jgi:hypothetical protein
MIKIARLPKSTPVSTGLAFRSQRVACVPAFSGELDPRPPALSKPEAERALVEANR